MSNPTDQMRKTVTSILLIAYTSLLLRPWLPFVMDFLAHTFWYAQHMATVHYENGRFLRVTSIRLQRPDLSLQK